MSVKPDNGKPSAGPITPSRRDLANAIRVLSMDAVQKANSGHPGMPMGMADIAEVLWNDYLKHNPANPRWFDRDRFMLSNGHGAMLHYSLLHLTGYALPMEQIKQFRQLHSMTPGHPEYGHTPGVEVTTGPLGQGIANGVGMAIAERALATQFNKPGFDIVHHYTYVFLGDGCLMEGISHEACSLAGTLGLGKLIAFYDDNGISIDGAVKGWFTDDTPKRFEAYGWHVIPRVDGHNAEAVKRAIETARKISDQPSLICCQTIIGWGAPNKQGTEEAAEFERRTSGKLPNDWEPYAQSFIAQVNAKAETIASRKASQNTLNGFGPKLPELLGGSADLTGSNLTSWSGSKRLSKDNQGGNYIYYGVREFGMSAMMTGIARHGGFIPYGGTFLTFSDYARNAVRMAGLMKQRVLFVYTHDSIGLGEDGPTHQSIEHLASLRLIPNVSVWRPCDAVESAAAWKAAIERTDGPSCLVFSRQNLAHQTRNAAQIAAIARGGYVLSGTPVDPQAIIIATGSEVGIAMQAQKLLAGKGKQVRVVSMPNTRVFDAQDPAYRDSVLPAAVTKRVAVEAGVTDFWRKYVGLNGKVVGIDTFGESAPAAAVFKHFGFTDENIVKTVEAIL